jgi:uncharacterized protein (DUF305 family)
MDNKPILYGVIGLLIGVGIATYTASTAVNTGNAGMMRMMGMRQGLPTQTESMMGQQQEDMMGMGASMEDMMGSLTGKTGDEFDEAFMSSMIIHHEGAIDMAKQAQLYAKHDEIRAMADDIIEAQTREINQMRQWQATWGY